MIALFLAILNQAAAGCPEPVPVADIGAAIQQAEFAWLDMDEDRLEARVATLDALVPCVDGLIESADIAGYFRARAFHAFASGDRLRARLELAAARAAAGDQAVLPPRLVPLGHPLREIEAETSSEPSTKQHLARPLVGSIAANGKVATAAPAARPWVLQVFDDQGHLVQTLRVDPGDEVVVYPVWRGQPKDLSDKKFDRVRRTRRVGLAMAMGGIAVHHASFALLRSRGFGDNGSNELTDPAEHAAAWGMFGGGLTMLAGQAMFAGGSMREARQLRRLGLGTRSRWGTTAWVVYGASRVTALVGGAAAPSWNVYFQTPDNGVVGLNVSPPGTMLFAGSLACTGMQVRANRRAAGRGSKAPSRSVVAVRPEVTREGWGARISVSRW